MVLRFACPCGAPYALADHLAGRTFKCTQCQRVLKIGNPAAAPPAQQAAPQQQYQQQQYQQQQYQQQQQQQQQQQYQQPDQPLMGSMEWSSGQLQQPGGLLPVDDDLPPAQNVPKTLSRTPDPTGGYELAPTEEELMNSLEQSEEVEEDEDEAPRRKKRGRSGRSKGRSTSGRKQTSGRQTKTRRSGGGKVEKPSGRSGKSVTRQCPVCDETIAKIAKDCPHCGARLARASAGPQVADFLKNYVGPLIGIVAVIGAVVYFWQSQTEDPRGKGPRERPTVAVSVSPKPTASPEASESPDASPEASETPTPEESPTRSPTPRPTRKPPVRATPTPSPTATRKPYVVPGGDDPEEVPEAATVGAGAIDLPAGPLKGAFEALRDADGSEIEAAIDALAGKEGVEAAIEASAKASMDRIWKLRLHRVLLEVGDEEAQRTRIKGFLADDSDRGNEMLVYTVMAALRLDPEGFREDLGELPFSENAIMGRALADAVLSGERPQPSSMDRLHDAYKAGDSETRMIMGPLLAMGGDAERLVETCEVLDHPTPFMANLARKALVLASGGAGPGEEASSGDWKKWANDYAPLRQFLLDAVKEPTGEGALAEIAESQQAVIERGAIVLKPLVLFVRDPATDSEYAGQVLGELIARTASRENVDDLNAILGAVDGRGERGVHIVRGCMLAGDAAIATEAIKALLRLGAAQKHHAILPDLLKPASPAALEPMVEYVNSLGPKEKLNGYMVLAAFRGPAIDGIVLSNEADKALAGNARAHLAARAGSAKIEKAVLGMIVGDGPKVAGLNSPNEALNFLSEIGSSNGASRLVKALGEPPNIYQLNAIRRIGGPEHGKKLKKLVATVTDVGTAKSLFKAYADLTGHDGISALYKRVKKKDGISAVAEAEILRLGGTEARALALKPFEEWKKSEYKRAQPNATAVRNLARCGKATDAKLLDEMLGNMKRGNRKLTREIVFAVGDLQYREGGARIVAGYVRPGHPQRAAGAVSLALLGMEEELGRLKEACIPDKKKTFNYSDGVVVAAMAFLAGEKALPAVEANVERAMVDEQIMACMAYAYAIAGENEGLKKLASSDRNFLRGAVARGIAWAGVSKEGGIATPQVLNQLRLDPDPLVRIEAAVASGYLGLEGAKKDIGIAVCNPGLILDKPRGGPTALARLAGIDPEEVPNLRAALWVAYRSVSKKTPRYHKDLGPGRVLEVQRGMRK